MVIPFIIKLTVNICKVYLRRKTSIILPPGQIMHLIIRCDVRGSIIVAAPTLILLFDTPILISLMILTYIFL